MAEYRLTKEEYDRLGAKQRRSRPLPIVVARRALRVVLIGGVLTLLAIPAYFGQWLFAAASVVLLTFLFWYPPRREERRAFERDCFKSGHVHVEIAPDLFRVRSGKNLLQIEYAELEALYEYRDYFLLYHLSGLDLRLPRASLAESDIAILQGLQQQLPAIAKKTYT